MKEKFRKFMQGRYGVDELSRALLVVTLAAVLMGNLTHGFSRELWNLISAGAILVVYFRMFSRNYGTCQRQNQKYLFWKNKILSYLRMKKSNMGQNREFHIYTCPGCGQKIRIPRGKGKIQIRCPKCGSTFIKRS